jgi:polysaccharide export outer membrane protein
MMRISLLMAGLLSTGALQAQNGAPPASGADLLVRPGDVVRISVWRQQELSGEFTVGQDGGINHPLYRSVKAAGSTVQQVNDAIGKFLLEFEEQPQYVVEVLFPIPVAGEVRQPNVYPMPAGSTVIEAMARAGGRTDRGRTDRIKLRREGREYRIDLADPSSIRYRTMLQSGDELVIERKHNFWNGVMLPFISLVAAAASVYNVVDR